MGKLCWSWWRFSLAWHDGGYSFAYRSGTMGLRWVVWFRTGKES